ncbi:ion transporter [Bacillus timonensis]|nr:ion transporter [Bacillus timonensis]
MYYLRKLAMKLVHMNNWVLFYSSISVVSISTLFIIYLEPETFPTPFEGFWWVMTTVTTVGYGDYYPTTTEGRLVAIFLYVIGIGLIGVVIGKIIDGFSNFRRKREEGKVDYKGKNHIVIIGWSKKANFAVEEILETDNDIDIVLIDTLEKAPLMHERVFYVRGNASDELTLKRVSIVTSKAVIIFADDSIDDSQLADGKSLLIATAIERMNTKVHTTVELLHEEHMKNFQHVHVDEFVLTHETVSRMAVRASFTKGISSVYAQLMSRRMGDDLFQIKANPDWKTYREAFDKLLNQGATLIADGDKLNINRRLDETIPKDSKLFVICDKETYSKITS